MTEPTTAEDWRKWWKGDSTYAITVSSAVPRLIAQVEALIKDRDALVEALQYYASPQQVNFSDEVAREALATTGGTK